MHEFWENLISRKYSPSKSIYDVRAIVLTKFQTGKVFKYFGYTVDHENVINVHSLESPAGLVLSIGIDTNEYGSLNNMTRMCFDVDEPKSDVLIKGILIDELNWKIDFFSTICE